ncbi:MAG: twin-arginine translocation signal domain-containing protein, partial [Chloroflexi bacterium]|nr:twin-arginine translocation signal domain-containing protein [Chloroflexota bacterium]
MELSRREFLKLSGAGAGGVAVLGLAKPRVTQAQGPTEIP